MPLSRLERRNGAFVVIDRSFLTTGSSKASSILPQGRMKMQMPKEEKTNTVGVDCVVVVEEGRRSPKY